MFEFRITDLDVHVQRGLPMGAVALRFHDAALELGSVPLPVVTARIDRFIAEDAKGLTRTWSSDLVGSARRADRTPQQGVPANAL